MDTFTEDKVNELKDRIENMKEKKIYISLIEVKPKIFWFERVMAKYSIEGYEVMGKDFSESVGREMLLYLKKDVRYSIEEENNNFCEFMSVKIKENDEVLVTLEYRSPSSSEENNMFRLIQEISDCGVKHKVIIRYINLPNINWRN